MQCETTIFDFVGVYYHSMLQCDINSLKLFRIYLETILYLTLNLINKTDRKYKRK